MKATNQTALNPETVNQFIIEVSLIEPVSKIVAKLNNREFRDCDIKWLDSKLEKFTKFACETLGLNLTMPIPTDKIMNDYVRSQYLNRFGIILEYFKTL